MEKFKEYKDFQDMTTEEQINAENELLEQSIADKVRVVSPGQMVARRFFRSKLSIVGLIMLVFLFVFSFLGPLFSPYGEVQATTEYKLVESVIYHQISVMEEDPDTGELVEVIYDFYEVFPQIKVYSLTPPSWKHLLGTDQLGFDIVTRLMYGGRVSLMLGFIVIFSEMILGTFLGSLAGFFGKWVDQLIMRVVDIFQCLPGLPILLLASSIIKQLQVPDNQRIYYLMGVLTFFGWSGIARLVRGQILLLREQEYMVAAEATGLTTFQKIFKHLIPNVMPQLIVQATLGLGGVILSESTLSYLGIGVPFPYAAWGTMIGSTSGAAGRNILQNYPNVWVPAGVCIVMAVLSFNFIGDGLRDAFDPKMKR